MFPCSYERMGTVQFSLFMHPDQAQNTSSGIQGQEATAVAVIYVTAPNICESHQKNAALLHE